MKFINVRNKTLKALKNPKICERNKKIFAYFLTSQAQKMKKLVFKVKLPISAKKNKVYEKKRQVITALARHSKLRGAHHTPSQ